MGAFDQRGQTVSGVQINAEAMERAADLTRQATMFTDVELMARAISFYLGDFQVDGIDCAAPVYLDHKRGGWAVQCVVPGFSHVVCLNQEAPRWRYKVGYIYPTRAEALADFARWRATTG